MAQANSHDIKVLNGLAENLADSAQTYREAVSEVEDNRYRQWFETRATERDAMAQNLRDEVIHRGGTPETDGSILAKAQRAFMDIKHALMRNDATVIDSLESSEDALQVRFTRALEDQSLSATTRDTLRRVQAQLIAIHDEISRLKHSMDSQREAANSLYPH